MPRPALGASNDVRDPRAEAIRLRPAPPARTVANRDRDGLLLAHKDHEPLVSGEFLSLAGVLLAGRNRGRTAVAFEESCSNAFVLHFRCAVDIG